MLNKKKYCFVPLCSNTRVNSPNIEFITVPRNLKLRKKWFKAAGRSDYQSPPFYCMYCCSEHFDFKEDLDNYLRHSLMKDCRLVLKSGVLPHKFDCQKRSADNQSSNTSSVIRCANKKTVSKIITPVDYQADEIDSNANLKQTTNNETSELPDEESSPDSTANEVTEPKVDENEKKFCQKIDSLDASQVHELLDAYMEYCQDAPTFDCSTCGVEFPTKALLDQHVCNPAAAAELTAKGSKSERKCCRICGRRFNKLASLHKHLLTHETVQRESEHTCAVCDLPFATALQLKNHMSTVHPLARPYKCTLCTKTFQTPATLRNHFETHSTEKPWQCSLCHKSFPKKYYLMTHVKSMHQRVRKYECSLCKQGLRHLGEYKAHMLRHAGTKPFQCDQCDKCYYQKGGLLTHMLTHSGETPFTCWVCLKGFRRKADCMRHVERSHSPTSANKMRMEDASASVEQEEATDFTISEEIKMEPVEEVETVDEKPQSDFDSLLEHLASEIGD